jgi:hypothetical protein
MEAQLSMSLVLFAKDQTELWQALTSREIKAVPANLTMELAPSGSVGDYTRRFW